ncbi:ExeA family protein [Congregibacter litoralis]|uniref:Type II secretory pathway, component ExeA (Predicted ATPase) n=1 Tax=Congregibacter litoralis KT71 TaxID=314285 RepID=A4A532_9GAMM|nr:AAA family ATPase [Congregibacter litoralis]EAQ98903.1 Type II secretory pathway, component ExeA (predicted ATPase) [Congregibacter litoralis KT71]
MYDRFYGFSEEPFRLSPDHHFAYQHRGYKKARAYMAYAFMRAEGFVMVTGRPGTGKTTLVGALMDDLAAERAQIANLVCSQLQADDLLSMVAHEFGVDLDVTNKGQQLQHLSRQLQKWHREGRRALLIVDEAQDLSVSAMEELRLLTNIQVGGKPLLQIFLLGQPELRELILRPEMEQVHQRIVAASHLQPLEPDETEEYIRHRLKAVGWQGDPAISKAVYPLISKFSEGIARRINLICSRLMLHGSVEDLHRIGSQDVRAVVEELQGESLAAGSVFTEHDFDVEDVYEGELEAVPSASATTSSTEDTVTTSSEPGSGTTGDRNALWRRRMRRQS